MNNLVIALSGYLNSRGFIDPVRKFVRSTVGDYLWIHSFVFLSDKLTLA